MASEPDNRHPAHGGLLSDKAGFWISLLCAIHCLATPIVLILVPSLASIIPGLEWVEYLAVGLSFGLAALQLYPEYQQHRKPGAVIFAAIGLTTLAFGIVWEGRGSESLHIGTMALGSVLMASAFYIGHRLKHH